MSCQLHRLIKKGTMYHLDLWFWLKTEMNFIGIWQREELSGEIQWILPTEYYRPGEAAQYLSDHNLMLSCDQRYGKEQMQYVIDTIKNYFRR